jgi:predicted esterase
MMRAIPALLAVLLLGPVAAAQYDPPDLKEPDAETLKAIKEKTHQLRTAVEALRKGIKDDFKLTGVEVYLKAAEWIVRHKEWYTADSGKQTLAVLDRGLQRAEQAKAGKFAWHDPVNQTTVRGYRSRVDRSVQPYAVSFPADYGKDPKKKWRTDVELHGRDASLTEVKFLFQRPGAKDAPKEQDYVRIEIFGRGNNAYRWAGESDVLEVIEHVREVERKAGRGELLDPRRVVLRGFSMGGAGTWHMGLHMPDRWCVIGPGAGFTTTRGYVKNLPDKLPDYQEKCLHIYDAVDYAENAAMVPVVAYSGEKDPQGQAAVNIEERLKTLGIPMTHLIGPGLEHRFPPEWQKAAQTEFAKYAGGRPPFPERVRFVTHTLKYPNCEWVELLALERHYDPARIDATWKGDRVTVETKNVRAVQFRWLGRPPRLPATVTIDGKDVSMRDDPTGAVWKRPDGGWEAVPNEKVNDRLVKERFKKPGLQGPIDDAFAGPFLCITGTGNPWHEATGRHARLEAERFAREWGRYMRGELPVKPDTEFVPPFFNEYNLVLFGDPSSNRLIADALKSMPIEWTKESIRLGGATYDASTHVPVMIYPSPWHPKRYVVINSGHTFHAADFRGTNALLYPRLGDFAILKPAPTEKDVHAAEVVTAGLFDDDWKVPAK